MHSWLCHYCWTIIINPALLGKEQQQQQKENQISYWTPWCGMCYKRSRMDWKFLMYDFSVTMAKCFDLKNTWNVLPLAMKSQLITFTDCNKLLRDLYAVKFMILRSDNVIYLYIVYQSALISTSFDLWKKHYVRNASSNMSVNKHVSPTL